MPFPVSSVAAPKPLMAPVHARRVVPRIPLHALERRPAPAPMHFAAVHTTGPRRGLTVRAEPAPTPQAALGSILSGLLHFFPGITGREPGRWPHWWGAGKIIIGITNALGRVGLELIAPVTPKPPTSSLLSLLCALRGGVVAFG